MSPDDELMRDRERRLVNQSAFSAVLRQLFMRAGVSCLRQYGPRLDGGGQAVRPL
jgi:hypothetical protein